MKIDKLLVSSAMLAAMCEKTGVDNLRMLEPFVLVCLADICEPRSDIPKAKVLTMLEQRFALRSMPEAVLDKILLRIQRGSTHIVREKKTTKDSRQFELIRKPVEQVLMFRGREEQAKRDTESVINALLAHIRTYTTMKEPALDEVKKYLGRFFENNGFDILFDPEELRGATIHNTDEMNYQIGRFILSTQETDPALFEKIVAIAQGMVVASVIYVDTTPISKMTAQRRLTGVDVFLDTTFLLYALGYKTQDQKHTADVLLELLRNNGANLYVFSNHLSEIAEILNAFKGIDAYDPQNGQMLEALIEEGYTSIEIDREIRNLKSNLMKLGVEVAPETQYTDSNGSLLSNKNAYIDYDGLKVHLIEKIPSYGKRPKMLDNDVSAIWAIMVKRSGMTYMDIESCNAIFVTTNHSLVRQGNGFLHYPPYSMHIPPIISDMDLTTILWIKYAMTMSSEISKLRLVEYARAALMPSAAVIEEFNSAAKRLVKKGDMTEDEAAFIRYSAYARAEIVTLCGGNASMLDDTSILAVRDRTREQFIAAEARRVDQAYISATREAEQAYAAAQRSDRAARAAKAKATASANELEAVKRKGRFEIAKLRKDAEDVAQRRAHLAGRVVEILVTLFVIGIMGTGGFATLKAGLSESIGMIGAIALAIATVSAIALWLPAFELSKWLYLRVSSKMFDHLYSIELRKCQKEIDRIALVSGLEK